MKQTWILLLAGWAWTLAPALAKPVRDGPVAVELIADATVLAPGQSFTAALRMELDDRWHIYWTNPGDSGLGPAVEWSLPDGFSAGELLHPPPLAIPTPPFMTYGHEGVVLLLVDMTVPADAPEGPVTLSAEVDWLVCRELCIPGYAEIELTLPVNSGLDPSPSLHADPIAAARSRLPVSAEGWTFRAEPAGNRWVMHATPPAELPDDITDVYFFPAAQGVVRHAAPQPWRRLDSGLVLNLVQAHPGEPPPDVLKGVLVIESPAGRTALEVDIPISGTSPSRLSNPERKLP